MKKFMILGVLASGLALGQVALNQPMNWTALLLNKLNNGHSLLRNIQEVPVSGVEFDDVAKAGADKVKAMFKGKFGVTDESLYGEAVLWKTCPYANLLGVEMDASQMAMRQAGYKMESRSTKGAEQVTIWKPLNRAWPRAATVLTAKCDGTPAIVTMGIYQIGDYRHLAYNKAVGDRFFGNSVTAQDRRVQVRSPLGPTRPSEGGILVELYNTTGQPLTVTLRVDARNEAGRVINSYTASEGVEVKANSARQVNVPLSGNGAVDGIVSIEAIR